jgi:hypothetical protein
MAKRPIAKKKLKRKSITEATIPADLPPFDTVPARIAIQAHWPAAAKSMSFRRPSLSITQIGTIEERK